MSLENALGDGNSQLRDDLLRQYQQDAPTFSGDAAVLTERLSRKLTPIGEQPSFKPADFSTPEPEAPAPEKAPDLSSLGTPVETPEASSEDLSSLGTPVAGPPPPPLGVGGQLASAGKGLLRGIPEQAGSMLQGAAVAFPTQPIAPEATALFDQLGQAKDMNASQRAKLSGQFMRTVGDRGMQMDFNAALQRIARGGDPAEEVATIRKRHADINAEAAGPIQEQSKYKTGTRLKKWADETVPMTDQEKGSVGGMIGGGVGGTLPYLGAAALGGPIVGIATGIVGMGASTAGSTFEAAKAKGASDEDAAKAAGWGAAIGGAVGALPLVAILRPFSRVSPAMAASGAEILSKVPTLALRTGQGAAVFATVGEAQEYLLTKVAQQYYDPEKGYSLEAQRVIANLITGALLGAGVHLATRPRPEQLSSPEEIADFIKRAAGRTKLEGPEPVEGEFTDVTGQRGLPGPEGSVPPPEPGPRPQPGGAGEAATPPKTDHQTLLEEGFSEAEIADMSPRSRAARLAEARQGELEPTTTEPAESAIPSSPDKVVNSPSGTGKRDAPVVATTVDDVLRASEVVQEPKSPAQAEAENYQHGHLELPHLGLDGRNGISIETGVGQLRKGIGADGKPWEVRMPVAYGRIKGTKGADDQPLDVFIGPNPTSPHVFMIDQRDPATDKFDEHKIMVGFDHPEGAIRAFKDAHTDNGIERIGAVKALTTDEFKDWLANGDHTKRFSSPTAPGSEPLTAEPGAGSLTEATAGGGGIVPKETPAAGGVASDRSAAIIAQREKSSARSPTEEPHKSVSFKTSRGSAYEVHEDGTTTRNKAARSDPGHEGDSGAKKRSAKTIYVDPYKASALSGAGLSDHEGKGWHVAIHGDRATLISWNAQHKGWGSSPESRSIPFTTVPEVNKAPVELWNPRTDLVPNHTTYSGQHAGNRITEIGAAEPVPAKPQPVPAKVPRAGADQPLSLLQFVASKGGMEPHPELKALDLAGDHRVQIPGKAGFFSPVRPTGSHIDQMREMAEEAGYLKGEHGKTSTVRDFLDAIDTELRGQPHHAEGEEGTKSKRQRTSEAESSAHARQQAVDGHVETINADQDYKHVPDDVKVRAAEIMADESLPLDDAVEQAAMRLVSEDADYGITPQLIKDTYGNGVSDEIQAKPAPRNGVVAQPERQGAQGNTGTGEEAQGHGKHVPDTGAQGGEAKIDRLLADDGYKLIDQEEGRKTFMSDGDAGRDQVKRVGNLLRSQGFEPDGLRSFKNEKTGETAEFEPGGEDTSGHYLHISIEPEVTAAHHQAIEDVLGKLADDVLPADIQRAAEILAERPGIPPDLAFQHAVIDGAVNQGFLTAPELEAAYGQEVKTILDAGGEGASGGSAHAGESGAEPHQERAGGGKEDRIVPSRGQAGASANGEAASGEDDNEPDAGRVLADTGGEAATAALEPEAREVGLSRFDFDGATVEVFAEDADEKFTATLSRKGPWDFNDTWPAPDPAVLEALEKEGRNPFEEPLNPRGIIATLAEGMGDLSEAVGSVRHVDDEIKRLRSGDKKPPRKVKVEDAVRALQNQRVIYGREVLDTAAVYEEVFGKDASNAMIAHTRKLLRAEEVTSPGPKVPPLERSSEEDRRTAERDAPTWAQILHELPMHKDGRTREHEIAFAYMKEHFGETAYQNLTPEQKHQLLDHLKGNEARDNAWALKQRSYLGRPSVNVAEALAFADQYDAAGSHAFADGIRSVVALGHEIKPETLDYYRNHLAEKQTTIPGTEPIGDGELAQRKADQPLKPRAVQQPADDGLFGDGAAQADLLDLARQGDFNGQNDARDGRHARTSGVGVDENAVQESEAREVLRGRDGLSGMGEQLRGVLPPHGTEANTTALDRTAQEREGLRAGQLRVGDENGAISQSTGLREASDVSGQDATRRGVGGRVGDQGEDAVSAAPDRLARGKGAGNTGAVGGDGGVQISVSGRDAGPEPEDVPGLEEVRGSGSVRPVEGAGGVPPVPGTDAGQAEADERGTDLAGVEGSGGRGQGDDVRVSGRHADQLAGREERAVKRDAGSVKGENFHIDPGGLAEDRSPRTKAIENINAIETANKIIAADRPATASEQRELSRYVGWGGIKGAFPDADGEYAKGFEQIGAQLKAALTPEEYDTARRSIQYAHYTSEDIIGAMWKLAQQLGFEGGKVFEPGMGVGNFPGLMPTDLAQISSYQGVELDHVSARIAKLLYPNWGVRRDDFTRTALPENAFDLAIGNPPFADIAIQSDPKYKQGFLLHDYFFAKSLDAVRPGGLLMFVTSAGTMNKLDTKARDYLAERAELVGAIRLPGNAFKKNAGTEVTTDIVILRKLMPGETASTDWVQTKAQTLPGSYPEPTTGPVASYFVDHPEMVLGKPDFNDKIYPGRYSVKAWDNFDLPAALAVAATKLPRNVMKAAETPQDRAETDFEHTETKNGSFYLKGDTVMQMQDGGGQPVPKRGKGIEGGKSAEQLARIKGLIPVRDALRETYAADLADDKPAGDAGRKKLNAAYDAFVKQYGPINKAEIQLRRPSVVQQETARGEAREEARYAGLHFDEGTFDAGRLLDANRPVAEIARARKQAREEAAAAGRPFSEGSFDPDDMKDVILDKRPNIEPFMDDQEAYRLRAIEHYDDASGKASKGLVFSKNVISRDNPPTIKGVNDAVLYVLNLKGRLDLDEIGALVNKSKTETIEALGERIYRVPGTKDTWETREAYLSGNVRKKLALAKKEAQRDGSLRRNVEALEAAQPAPLAPAQIHAGLGMPWIPAKIIEQFATEELGLSPFKASYIPVLAQWVVSGDTDSVASVNTHGTSRRNATALLGDALNHITPKIYDEGADKTRILNINSTQEAQDKLQSIKDRFKKWVFADDARADPLAAHYNENYNNLVVRQYDGSYLTTPGVSSDWKWRPHQTRVIARIIQDGNTYMAHAVGAGKTSAMIGAGMEMRRLGLVKKPMYVVPNHMLAQFTKEFYEQYPTARIAVADDRNFHADRRKQFMANVALDDLDAVIITHTNFGMIPVSDEFSDSMIQEELERYRNALSEMPKGGDNRITRSRIEKQIERLEQRLSGKSTRRRDNVFTFDQMGADFVFVDEAQEFRKLDFTTQMSNLKGITPEGSGKAWDLYVKTKLLEQRNPGRNLVLASGTPVTNTMAELYTVSRYLQPHELAERGLSAFDAWAGAFGEEVSELEQDAAGGYKPVSRFAKFVNVAELSAMVRQTMDVVTSRQLEQYVTRPKIKGGKRQMHLAEKSPALTEYQDGLAARMKAMKGRGKPQKGDDIMLTVIGDGRHAAIDMRLVGGESDPDFPSKLEMLIENLWQTAEASKRQKFYRPRDGGYDMSAPVDVGPATQMVFANLGISAKRGLPVHDYIRAELTRRGMPRDQIAIISEHKTHIAKQKLFNDMNAGKVRVLIGSVAKMGTGVNAQRRLIAIHNLDPLWYPSDDEQRNGRGVRQGNWNPEIGINDYSTKGTYDSTMWGLMEKKARFIQGFFEGDPSMRDMDDLGEASQYAQAKALTTNDPRLMRLTELKQDLERAERRKSSFESERYALKRRRGEAVGNVDWYGNRVAAIKQDIRARQDIGGDKFTGKVGKASFDKRAEFGEAVLDQLDKLTTMENHGRYIVIGEIGGFPLRIHVRKTGLKEVGNDLLLKRQDADSTVHGTSALGIVRSIESTLSGFEVDLAHAQGAVDTANKFLAESEGKDSKKFEGDADLNALAGQVQALEAELSKKDEPKAEPGAPDEEARTTFEPLTEAGAAKRAELERMLTEAVHQMAPTVKIKFHDGLIPVTETVGWGDMAARYKGAVGLYRPAKQLIELSFDTGTPISAAFHEAYHAIEHLLQNDRERALMVSETPRIRKVLKQEGVTQFSKSDIEQLDGAEVRAIGFELYRRQREKMSRHNGLHLGVRRWYHRLTEMTRRIRNGVNGLGFQTAEDIFQKTFEGDFADRTPPPLGTRYDNADDVRASMRNPFNAPLRDSVGEEMEEALSSKKERFIEGYQNLSRPVQRLEEIVEARLAGELPDSQAFYQKKRLYPGKVAAQATDFNRNHLDPFVDYLKANNIDREEAGDILYALHAFERNREMDRINMGDLHARPADMVLGRGSGMSDDTADRILARYPRDVVNEIDRLAGNIRDFINTMMVQSGLESSYTVDGWREMYQHYVPLSGWEDAPEDAPSGYVPRFEVRGPEVRRAFGRKSKADNPLVNLIDQAYRTIERAMKNEYLQALDNALHELEPDDLENFVRFDRGQPKKEISKRTGLVRTVDGGNGGREAGAVPFKRGGNVHYIIFENPQIADAVKRMHADGLGILQGIIDIQNKLKATWTHYSPEFLIRHFLFRYPIEGALNSFEQKESGAHGVGRYIADSTPFLGNATKAIFASNKGQTHANPDVAELQRYWEEMRKAGGAMMFRQMRDTNLLREHMRIKLNSLTNTRFDTLRAKWHAGVEAMDTVTNALDNALRLAAYASARKQGKSVEEAAIIARDATVDFQQSGRWKNMMSVWAPFSGVAINTGARMTSALGRSRIMRQVFGATVLAGFLSGMFNYLVGGDDKDGIPFADKLAWWEKGLTFTLINPYDRDAKDRPQPVHIPMPYNWAFPLMIGQVAAAIAFTKDKHGVKKALGALLRSGLEALTPIGAEHNPIAQIAPELTRPFVHTYTNEGWNGVPLHQDAMFQKGPRSASGRKTTGEGWKLAAGGLNAATGGDARHSGIVDIYPEDLREVLGYYSGSDTIMRFGRNVAGSVGHAIAGEPQEPSRIPFARVVRGTDYDAADKSRVFERRREEKQPWNR